MHQKSWNFDDSKTIDLSMIGVLKGKISIFKNYKLHFAANIILHF